MVKARLDRTQPRASSASYIDILRGAIPSSIFLRLFAAGLVSISHLTVAFDLGPTYQRLTSVFSDAGLGIFFALSGTLMASSVTLCRSSREYFSKRFLRIWPPMAVMTLITGAIMSPLAYMAEKGVLAPYFSLVRFGGLEYLGFIVYAPIASPGSFADFVLNPKNPGTLNGSLWTIPLEIQAYILIFLLFRRASESTKVMLGAAVALTACTLSPFLYLFGDVGTGSRLLLISSFFAGACVSAVSRTKLRLLLTIYFAGAVVFGASLLLWAGQVPSLLLLGPLYPLVMISLLRLIQSLKVRTSFDPSFGYYLWHYPVFQFFAAYSPPQAWPITSILAVLVAATVSCASWIVIERPLQVISKKVKFHA